MTTTNELTGFAGLIQAEAYQPKKSGCWNWIDGGVVVKWGCPGEEQEVARVQTQFPSRDGLRIIDAIRNAAGEFHVQVSDHGCGRKSAQVFDATGLVADVNLGAA